MRLGKVSLQVRRRWQWVTAHRAVRRLDGVKAGWQCVRAWNTEETPKDRLSPNEGTSGQAPIPVPERGHSDAPRPALAKYGPEDFPGCELFHLPVSEIDHYEGRLEFWDGCTETAWKVCEPTSIQHEGPSRRLEETATRVASVRGSRIVCFGLADLVRLDAPGRKRWLRRV